MRVGEHLDLLSNVLMGPSFGPSLNNELTSKHFVLITMCRKPLTDKEKCVKYVIHSTSKSLNGEAEEKRRKKKGEERG